MESTHLSHLDASTCPSDDDLAAFSLGLVPAGVIERIVEHVDACDRCEAVLSRLEQSGDALVNRLRSSPRPSDFLAEPGFRLFRDRMQSIRPIAAEQPDAVRRHALPMGLPGQLGPYELLSHIGDGGMGSVLQARHVHLKRVVALKILAPRRSSNPQLVKRFYVEMEAVGKLDHPHVVRALDAGEAEGFHYLAMEYVHGVDLSLIQNHVGRLSIADACEVIRQAALGLDGIERHGLVHRDIKPSNLILSNQGVVKILDLGLARLAEADSGKTELTTSYQMLGTVDYMPPEQISKSHPIDIRSDLYSLGCTLYKLLTGSAPFTGPKYDTPDRKLYAHCNETPRPISVFRPDLPTVVVDMVDRLLTKSPDQRYASPAEVARRLAPLTKGARLKALLTACGTAPIIDDRAEADSVPLSLATTSTLAAPKTPGQPRELRAPVALSRRKMWVLCAAVLVAAIVGPWAFFAMTDNRGGGPTGALFTEAGVTDPETAHPPADSVPLTLDMSPPLRWRLLLDEEPKEICWPRGDGISNWIYDKDLQQLTMHCNNVGVIQFGTCQQENYQFQVGIHQSRWVGNVGLFWGLHDDVYGEHPCVRYQFLDFRSDPRDPVESGFNISRGIMNVILSQDGPPRYVSSAIASAEVSAPREEQILDVVIRDSALSRVRLNGAALPDLLELHTDRPPVAADSRGGFGVNIGMSSCVVRNARFMILDRSQ